MYKALFIIWLIGAVMNFAGFFIYGYDSDKLLIAALELLLAQWSYRDYKRGA